MSTREEMIEDAKRDAWEERESRRACPDCYGIGGEHRSGCPSDPREPDVEESDEEES